MKKLSPTKLFTLVFGFFLGLCVWKFGNPVILDQSISAPASASGLLRQPWPLHWAKWALLPLVAWGVFLLVQKNQPWPIARRFWILPATWLVWQLVSATHTVDAFLTQMTLWQFAGCVACYVLGVMIFARDGLWRWLLPGLMAAFIFCLIQSVNQRVYIFPRDYQALTQGQRSNWTNFPPATLTQMEQDNVLIQTNGVTKVNPAILKKVKEKRVNGTLVYPNALAGIVLLLWPVSLVLAFGSTKSLKPGIRFAVAGLMMFLGGASLFWSGSKLGWLLALGMGALYLLRLKWSQTLKWLAVELALLVGMSVFAVRFHHYFAKGATSVVARFDYWHAAVQNTVAEPVFGSGPGTFQHPYARLKSPKEEMAKLTHNDYLEQFSDSGVIGGIAYVAWIFLALLTVARKLWPRADAVHFGLLMGVSFWFVQGLAEFSLYIPALAWTAFTLLGLLLGVPANEFDK